MDQCQLWHLLINRLFVVILLQMSCINYTSVAGVIYFFNSGNINHQSFADTSSYNITRLPIFMPMAYQEFVLWIREGKREERKKEKGMKFLV
jgi:hypothetical protein